MDGVGAGGGAARRRVEQVDGAWPDRRARQDPSRHVRAIRAAISPRLAMKRSGCSQTAVRTVRRDPVRVDRVNRDTPSTATVEREDAVCDPALHDRVVAPMRGSLARTQSSGHVSRLSHSASALSSGAGTGSPSRPRLAPRRAPPSRTPEPFLRFLGRPLPGDDPRRVPLRRAVAEAADLADDRLRRPGCGRPGPPAFRDGGVDRRVERGDRPRRPRGRGRSARPLASKRRPPGKRARAWLSPILAMTNGLITDGRIPRRVSVKPKRGRSRR